MIPEGQTAVAVPADHVASIDWFLVLYKEARNMVPIVVSPLMAPGVIQIVNMKNGVLEYTVFNLGEDA